MNFFHCICSEKKSKSTSLIGRTRSDRKKFIFYLRRRRDHLSLSSKSVKKRDGKEGYLIFLTGTRK